VAVNRHWFLDCAGPRSDEQFAAAAELLRRERELTDERARAEAEVEAAAAEATSAGKKPSEGEVAAGDRPEELDRTERGEPVSVIVRPSCE
jgi:nucleotide-binding universal stress UspA family protein